MPLDEVGIVTEHRYHSEPLGAISDSGAGKRLAGKFVVCTLEWDILDPGSGMVYWRNVFRLRFRAA